MAPLKFWAKGFRDKVDPYVTTLDGGAVAPLRSVGFTVGRFWGGVTHRRGGHWLLDVGFSRVFLFTFCIRRFRWRLSSYVWRGKSVLR